MFRITIYKDATIIFLVYHGIIDVYSMELVVIIRGEDLMCLGLCRMQRQVTSILLLSRERDSENGRKLRCQRL